MSDDFASDTKIPVLLRNSSANGRGGPEARGQRTHAAAAAAAIEKAVIPEPPSALDFGRPCRRTSGSVARRRG